jgi:hypothetical protein
LQLIATEEKHFLVPGDIFRTPRDVEPYMLRGVADETERVESVSLRKTVT